MEPNRNETNSNQDIYGTSPPDNGVITPGQSVGPEVVQPDTLSQSSTGIDSSQPVQPVQPPQAYGAQPQPSLPAEPVPPITASPYVAQAYSGAPLQGNKGGRRKKLLIASACAALSLLLIGGFVFGYYLPNKPENVYKTGLNRSGQALEKLVLESLEQENMDQYKNGDASISLEFSGDGQVFNGTGSAQFTDKKAKGSLETNLELSGQPPQQYKAQFVSEKAEGKELPTTFFQISGIAQLDLEQLLPGINAYDNKWIAVEDTYVESLRQSYETLIGSALSTPDAGVDKDVSAEQEPELTNDDISEVTKVFMEVTRDHVFTGDSSKSIFTQKSYEGKEQSDDITVHRYKVGLNKQNTIAYCNALIDALYTTKTFEKFKDEIGQSSDEAKKSTCASLETEFDENYSFDMYVDTKYKLIHKFRFTDEEQKDSYLDVGQRYKGGDTITFFVDIVSPEEKYEAHINLETNTKTGSTKFDMEGKLTEGSSDYDAKFSLAIKPLEGDISFEKPADAIKIQDVLTKFGVDPAAILESSAKSAASVSGQDAAKDAERQADIKALHTQMEAYYAQYGGYPTLTNLNDFDGWRKQNLPNVDPEAFSDPDGKDLQLNIATATGLQYGYDQIDCDFAAGSCAAYKLSALLSDGQLYTKESLN